MTTQDLHGETDAVIWAEEFVQTCEEHDIDPRGDTDFMVGWFANAIESGRSAEAASGTR